MEEYRYRFKGRDARKNRRMIIEKLINGRVVQIKSLPKANDLWEKLDA